MGKGHFWQLLGRYAPVLVALLGLSGIYALIAERFALGGWLLLPTLILVLAALFMLALGRGKTHQRRLVGVLLLSVITGAEAVAVVVLWAINAL